MQELNKMNSVLRLLILVLPITLAGCSYLTKSSFSQNRDRSYLAARSIPPLKIPPGIAGSAFHSAYPVSDRQFPVSAEDVSIVPPGLNS
jgi:uncharacterized lipoprotein